MKLKKSVIISIIAGALTVATISAIGIGVKVASNRRSSPPIRQNMDDVKRPQSPENETIKNINHLEIKEKARVLKDLLASDLKDPKLLNSENIDLKFKNSSINKLDEKIKITYELITGKTNNVNDDEGSLVVRAKFQVDNQEIVKDLKLIGFKTLIQSIKAGDLNFKVSNKDQILASELLSSNQNVATKSLELKNQSKKLDLNKYNLTYEKIYFNDVTASAKIRVNAKLKTNENINNKFEFVINGFKKYVIADSLEAKFTLVKKDIAIEELKRVVTEAFKSKTTQEAFASLKNYLDISLPEGLDFSFVSIETKNDDPESAILTYKLVIKNLHSGSQANPSSKNGVVESKLKTFEIKRSQIQEEQPKPKPKPPEKDKPKEEKLPEKKMDRVSKIELTQNSVLKSILPSKVNNNQLTSSNIRLLKNDGEFILPYGTSQKFEILKADDVNGILEVKLSLSQGEKVIETKTLELQGLLSELDFASQSDFSVIEIEKRAQLNIGRIASKTNELEKLIILNPKAKFKMENYDKTFLVSYISDRRGKIIFKMTLSTKKGNKSKVFNFEIDGFYRYWNTPEILMHLENPYKLTVQEMIDGFSKLRKGHSPREAADKLKELFVEFVPVGYEFYFVDFKAKANAKDIGVLTYYLKHLKTEDETGHIQTEVQGYDPLLKAIEKSLNSISKIELDANGQLKNKLATEFEENQVLDSKYNSEFKLYDKDNNLITPLEGVNSFYKIHNNPDYDLKEGSIKIEFHYSKDDKSGRISRTVTGLKKFDASLFDVAIKNEFKYANYFGVLRGAKENFKFLENSLETRIFNLNFKDPKIGQQIIKHYSFSVSNLQQKTIEGDATIDVKVFQKGQREPIFSANKAFDGFKNFEFFEASGLWKDRYKIENEQEPNNHTVFSIQTSTIREDFIKRIDYIRNINNLEALSAYLFSLIDPVHLNGNSFTYLIRTNNLGSKQQNRGAHRLDYTSESGEQFRIVHNLNIRGLNQQQKKEKIRQEIFNYFKTAVFAIRKDFSIDALKFESGFTSQWTLSSNPSKAKVDFLKKYYDLYIPSGYELTIVRGDYLWPIQYVHDKKIWQGNEFTDFELNYTLKKDGKAIKGQTILTYAKKVYLRAPQKNGLNPVFVKADFIKKYNDNVWRWALQHSVKQIKYRDNKDQIFFVDVHKTDQWGYGKDNSVTLRQEFKKDGKWIKNKVKFKYVDGKIQIEGDHQIDGLVILEPKK